MDERKSFGPAEIVLLLVVFGFALAAKKIGPDSSWAEIGVIVSGVGILFNRTQR